MFFAGATVNPVRSGISPITNHPISKFVQNTSNKWNYNMFYVRHENGFIEIEKEDGTKELVENYTYEKLTNRPLDCTAG